MKYEFHVADYVEDINGRIGYINSICQCKFCEKRGLYEPCVMYTNGDCDYITVHEYEKGFPSYNRIGQYDFTKKDDGKIEPLGEEYTKSFTLGTISRKINELVEAVNELRDKND